MGIKYQALKGMEDLLPGEIEKWQWLEERTRVFFESRGFKEIRTPLLEYTELFARSVGEASDIVHKEMFSFEDRGGRNVTLRPEMTASVARAVIEHGLLKINKSLRLYYRGPMFRAERPQAGRKRQFHQIGIEMINEANLGGFNADAEIIFQLCSFLSYVGLKDFRLRLNDLGDFAKQRQTALKLKQYFSREKSKLCEDCHYRLDKNVFRIFDCKNERCQPIIDKAPWDEIAPLSKEFGYLMDCLKSGPVPFDISRRLVRGLDYYNGAVFEVVAAGLGAQDALAGGGRYDGLYESLGGESTPATGFSIGIERLLTALEVMGKEGFKEIQTRRVYFASLVTDSAQRKMAEEQALRFRESGFLIETLPQETSLSAHLKRANQLGIRWVVICGEDELRGKQFALKDLEKRTQEKFNLDQMIPTLQAKVSS